MASTGEVFPTQGTTTSEAPWSDNTWTSPENVTANDATYASVTAGTFDATDQTFVLKAFTFDFSGIPSGSTIDGVTARVEARADSTSVFIDLAQLLDTARAKVGTNLALAPSNDIALTTSDTVYTIGGSANLWGNALTEAWVKDADFGIALGVRADVANSQVFIDYVTLEIEYTAPDVNAPAGVAAGTGEAPQPTVQAGEQPPPLYRTITAPSAAAIRSAVW
jgi:hypothetical protein